MLRTESQWLEGEVRKHLTAQELKTLRQLLEKLQARLVQASDSPSPEEVAKAE
jgi:hypothetical protein